MLESRLDCQEELSGRVQLHENSGPVSEDESRVSYDYEKKFIVVHKSVTVVPAGVKYCQLVQGPLRYML